MTWFGGEEGPGKHLSGPFFIWQLLIHITIYLYKGTSHERVLKNDGEG